MFSLLLLIVFTSLIIFIQRKIWKITPNVIFPMCTFIFYYWSLAGAWIFTLDQSFGEFGRSLYMSYYVYLEKVYPVKLDSTYSLMICFYSLFIISFQSAIWYFLKKKSIEPIYTENKEKIKLNPVIVSVSILFFICLSFYIVKAPIYKAIKMDESAYLNVRRGLAPFYTFHQLFNLASSFLSYFYLSVLLSRNSSKMFEVVPSKIGNVLFGIAFLLNSSWLLFLGNRHELLIVGITAFLFITYPIINKKHLKPIAIIMGLLFINFVLTDPMRSLTPKLVRPLKNSEFLRKKENVILIKDYIETEKKANALLDSSEIHDMNVASLYYSKSKLESFKIALASVVFSNEMFSGQFSLYASLKENIPITYGHSIKSAFYTFIPRTIISQRPESSYEYYSNKLKLNKNQGFTINHATDWYLNFGIIGLVLGGLFWGILMVKLFVWSKMIPKEIIRSLTFLAMISLSAYFSIIIRGGIDVLKVIVFESILIPIMLVLTCHLLNKLVESVLTKKEEV